MFTQNTKMGKLWQELPRSNINKVSINGNLDQWMWLLWNESLKSPQYTEKYKCLCCFPVVGTFLARTEIRQRFASSPWRNPWFQTDMTDHAGSEGLKQKYILECFICLTKFCGAKCQVYCISKPLDVRINSSNEMDIKYSSSDLYMIKSSFRTQRRVLCKLLINILAKVPTHHSISKVVNFEVIQ